MTAYSFQKIFADDVASGNKCQTIRGPRNRHARVGEPIQLYTGMRTKQCRKLVEPDPICSAVLPVNIEISFRNQGMIENVTLDGCDLTSDQIEQFCRDDGFGNFKITARNAMGRWFAKNYGTGIFKGFVIQWFKP